MGSEKSSAVAAFASAHAADRRVAGVAAAARAVRALAEAGHMEIRLEVGGDAPPAPATLDDIERVRGAAAVAIAHIAQVDAPYAVPTAWEIVRRTGKPGDGLVSRWINRPVSQRITLLALTIPGARPVHATAATALIALAMFAVLLSGGPLGLILGGVLFQAASVVDGVDGEMARATHRASAAGAALDSAVDLATNLLFFIGLIAALADRDGPFIAWVGGWGLGLFALGMAVIGWRMRRGGAPLGFDLVKEGAGRPASPAAALARAATIVTSRDFFALLFMVMILAGLERAVVYLFAAAGTVWIPIAAARLLARPDGRSGPGFRGAA